MTNNKHKEIMETELKEWEGKEIFTLGDKECLPMLKNSLKRVLTEQLEELERWILAEATFHRKETISKAILSHLHSEKEIINNK